MMPLTVGEKQTHFLLVANPSECAFCMSGGPESVVEVKAKSGGEIDSRSLWILAQPIVG